MPDRKMQIEITAKDATRRGVSSAERNIGGLEKSAVKLGTAISAAVGVVGLAKLAHDFVSVNAEVQKLNASLNTVTGSQKEANRVFAMLRDFASETPFQINELTSAYIKMKALGLDPNIETMRSFGDTASAMGKSLDQMVEAVADASTGEFERLKEFGIKTKQQGDSVVFTFRGVETQVSKNSDAIVSYLRRLGDEDFAGGMLMQMNTIGGAFSNLQDSYSNLLADMGSGAAGQTLIDAMTELSARLSDPAFVNAMANFAAGAATLAQIGLDGLTSLSEEVSVTAQLAAAYSTGQIGFIEWATASKEDALRILARLEDQTGQRFSIGENFNAQTGMYGEPETVSNDKPSPFNFTDPNDHDGPLQAFLEYSEQRKEAEFELQMWTFEQQNAQREWEEEMSLTRLERLKVEADEELAIEAAKYAELNAFTRAGLDVKLGMYASHASALTQGVAHTNKAMFNLHKVARMAEIAMELKAGIARTWNAYPYPWNVPMTALHAATGLAQLSDLSGASFSDSSRPASIGYGGGNPDSPVVTQPAAAQPVDQGPRYDIRIQVMGHVVDEDKFGRNIVESLGKALRDGKEF